MKVIIRDVELDHLDRAICAARWLLLRPEQKDAILSYGKLDLYVRRNKGSVTVRPTRA